MSKQQIGVIGMVMGKNLALNIDRGYSVSIYNRTTKKAEAVIEEHQIKIYILKLP